MKRFRILLLIACGCYACSRPDYMPMPTYAGWRIFCYADEALTAHGAIVLRAVQFDEYYRQTTDEDRRRVQDRYFPRERIVCDGNVWQVLSTEYTWAFELSEDRSLAEPGAEWRIACWGVGQEPETVAVIRAADGGALSVQSEIGTGKFAMTASLELRVSQDAEEKLKLEFFAGQGALRGKDTPRLDIDYSIAGPVVWSGSEPGPLSEGALDITAHNEADNADEAVKGRYLGAGTVEITYCGKTDIWNFRYPYGDYPE